MYKSFGALLETFTVKDGEFVLVADFI